MVKIICSILFLLLSLVVCAQDVDVFARIKSNRSEIYVEQPVKITVSVHTATWFTKPLNIPNIQVDGAFVQSFKRTQSSIEYFNKKKYATLTFYYIVFPYKEGDLNFPELTITTETPPENDYKGIQKNITTKAIRIHVKSIPRNADKDHWLVATNATITQKWSKNLNKLRVGDVLERTITVKANGTLPSFIDESEVGDIDFGTIYSSSPQFIDLRNSEGVNGQRIDKYSYLLEKEGEYTLPEVKLTWYNPYLSKYYERIIPAEDLTIDPNEDFEALQNLKDSLYAINQSAIINDETEKETPDYWMWSIIAIGALLSTLLIRFLLKVLQKLISKLKLNRIRYKQSEAFIFKAINQSKNEREIVNAIYRWIDASKSIFGFRTTKDFSDGNKRLSDNLQLMKKNIFSNAKKVTPNINKTIDEIHLQRKNSINNNERHVTDKRTISEKINPS